VKVADLKLTLAVPKPRDPNQAVLASKKNAGGAMRDKKHELKRGEQKHKGRVYETGSFRKFLTMSLEEAKGGPLKGDDIVEPHDYSVKILHQGKDKRWPALKGEIYEKDVLIGTFSRGAVRDGYVPPIESKFRTSASKARFEDFSDSLSIEETIEALLP
jgi:hypothetical protein